MPSGIPRFEGAKARGGDSTQPAHRNFRVVLPSISATRLNVGHP